MHFSENLRNLRKEKEYSQEYLAEKMNVTRQTISKWENGTAMPDLKKLTELADLFEVSMDKLLGIDYEGSNEIKDNNIENLISAFAVSFEETYNKRFKDLILKLIVTLICCIYILIIIIIPIRHSLIHEINNLQEQINQISIIPFSEDDESNKWVDDEITAKITGINKDSPNLISIQLKYSPDEYPKNSDVTFYIYNKGYKSEEKEGSFIAEIDLDAKKVSDSDSDFYISISGDEKVSKKYFEIFVDELYFTLARDINVEDRRGIITMYLPDGALFEFTPANQIDITEVNLKAVSHEDKEVFNLPISIKNGREMKYALDFGKRESIEFPTTCAIKKVYFEFKDNFGITYRYYFSNDDIGLDPNFEGLQIEFPD